MKVKIEYSLNEREFNQLFDLDDRDRRLDYVRETVCFMKDMPPSTWEETDDYLDEILMMIGE